MRDFIFHNPCKIYFGKDVLSNLPAELKKIGNKVLMVYGGGSIKRNGLYDTVKNLIEGAGLKLYELDGVEPNPRHTTVNRGVEICKKENIDVILAVGGGSTIDCSKGIAAASKTADGDVWKLVKNGVFITDALPIITILTNAATGSEMNSGAVISNMDTNEKLAFCGNALIPVCSFENPEYAFTLPTYQTACGAFDIFNHVLDFYYFAGEDTFELLLEFAEAIMRTVVKYAPIAMKNPTDYEARANLTWASSLALNDLLDAGQRHDGICHFAEHELSAYYDITHGHGLAILTPRWLEYILDEKTSPAIYRLGVKVFDVKEGLPAMEGAKLAINAVYDFCFNTLGLKSTLTELGIDETHFEDMAKHAVEGGDIIGPTVIGADDIIKIFKACL